MSKEIKEYDEKGNLIYSKRYDKNAPWRIWCEDDSPFEIWFKYDKNNNRIYSKDSDGWEYWWKYDENNKRIRSYSKKNKITQEEHICKKCGHEHTQLDLNNDTKKVLENIKNGVGLSKTFNTVEELFTNIEEEQEEE